MTPSLCLCRSCVLLEEEAIKERTGEVRAIVPLDVSTFLLNEKRAALNEIEQISKSRIVIVPNPNMETPHFNVERVRDSETESLTGLSYDVDIEAATPEIKEPISQKPATPMQQAAVQSVAPRGPAPTSPQAQQAAAEPAPKKGLVQRLKEALFGSPEPKEEEKAPAKKPSSNSGNGNRNQRSRGKQNNRNRRRNNDGERRRGSSENNRSENNRR